MSLPVDVQSVTHENQLTRLTAEVQALRSQLHRAQRLAMVGTMTAMVAHEFNNILTPIINYAQLAQKNPKMTPKAILKASEGGKRASEICKAILGISRDEPNEPKPEELVPLIEEILSAMGRDPAKDGISLVIDISPEMTIVICRPRLQQVIMNLLLNARTAVLAGNGPREIVISARPEVGRTVLTVRDSGIGMEADIIEHIFQPFFTTHGHQDEANRGHGLGLAICKDIITSMHGEISVESTPGEGTTFTILLPDAAAE